MERRPSTANRRTNRFAVGRRRQGVYAENVAGDFTLPGLGNVLCTWLWHERSALLSHLRRAVSGTVLEPGKLGPAAAWDESYKYFFQTRDGTPYIVNGAKLCAARSGDPRPRSGPTLQRRAALDRAGRPRCGLAGRARQLQPPPPILHVTWLEPAPKIDGDLSDWDMRAGVRLTGSGKRRANVALGRDRLPPLFGLRGRRRHALGQPRPELADAVHHGRLRRPDAGDRSTGRSTPPCAGRRRSAAAIGHF